MTLKLKINKKIQSSTGTKATRTPAGSKEDLNDFADAMARLNNLWEITDAPVKEAQQCLVDLIDAMYEGKPIPRKFQAVRRNIENITSLEQILSYGWNLKLAAEGLGLLRSSNSR